MKWVALFLAAGQLGGIPYAAGDTESECKSEARRVIRNIKAGAELMGQRYVPVTFTCVLPGGKG